jgi:hypothetical protein
MSQRPPQSHTPARTSRRHDRQGGYDLTDIYEARLLAQGYTANDFVTRRSSAEPGILPTVRPVRIGRGSPAWDAAQAAKAVATAPEPAEKESPEVIEPADEESFDEEPEQ